ncbi:MAG: hypothetical protein JSU87_01480 [Gemmatimonadota bacterium]|nr:MAG: hypothetical protein JSU87_01480 [Gemmatimonadota bacterium]
MEVILMPYIASDRRVLYDGALAELGEIISAKTPAGDLNYVVTRVLSAWLRKRGLSYAAIADVVAVLETAKLEFYRRVAARYEDHKIVENGDVYDTPARG